LSLRLLQGPIVEGFVKRRCRELGLEEDTAYYQLATKMPSELDLLTQEIAVPETWFFRYPASFELLIDHCSSLLHGPKESLRMLSIACASGEEPYGMTMAAFSADWAPDRVTVHAVDRQPSSLAIARHARYSKNSFREPVPAWAEQWFDQTSDAVQIDERVVRSVRFDCGDVLGDVSSSLVYDVVFCRNLFIYLGDSFQAAGVKHTFALRRKSRSPVLQLTPTNSGNSTARAAPTAPRKHRRDRKTILSPEHPVVSRPTESEATGGPTLEAARALADAGLLEEAMATLQTIESPLSVRPEFFELLGSVKLSMGHVLEARNAFNNALYFDQNHEAALLQLSIIFGQLGKVEQASRYRQRAMRAHKGNQNQSPEPGV
jgi:chemotaxis protein methyltransferase WspC